MIRQYRLGESRHADPHNDVLVTLSHLVPGVGYAELKDPRVVGSVPEHKDSGS